LILKIYGLIINFVIKAKSKIGEIKMIKAKMIKNQKVEDSALSELYNHMHIYQGKTPQFMVFKTKYNNKTLYHCWAGGEIQDDDEIALTPVGSCALSALMNIEESNNNLIVKEIGSAKNCKKRIMEAMNLAKDKDKICFIGDMSDELDGEMTKVFKIIS